MARLLMSINQVVQEEGRRGMAAAPAMAWGSGPLWFLRRGWAGFVRIQRRTTSHKHGGGGSSSLVCLS